MLKNVILFQWGTTGSDVGMAELGPLEGEGLPPDHPISASILAHGRRETFLSLSNVDSVNGFWSAVATIIPLLNGERSVTATYRPMSDSEVPGVGYQPGDYINVTNATETGTESLRVHQIAGRRNPRTGRMDFTPSLESPVDTLEQRLAQAVKRIANGTVGGKSRTAQPDSIAALKSGTRTVQAGPTFNTGSALTVGAESSPWTPTESVKLVSYEIAATGTGSGTSSGTLYTNGSPIVTFSLAAGETLKSGCIAGLNRYFYPTSDKVTLRVVANGGHPGFSIKTNVVPTNS